MPRTYKPTPRLHPETLSVEALDQIQDELAISAANADTLAASDAFSHAAKLIQAARDKAAADQREIRKIRATTKAKRPTSIN